MSGVLKTVGKVAGIIAMIPGPWQPIAAAVAVVATVAGQLTAKKPVPVGSTTNILIGANQPSRQIIGRCYSGGSRILQVGYKEDDGIPNAIAAIVDVYSCGGPVQGLVGIYADFNLINFSGTNAIGYYAGNYHTHYQLGQTPEPSALQSIPDWTGIPNWGADYKLSGFAAILHQARFPPKGDVHRSGLPQYGAVWDGVLTWDPRLDDTYDGGSGPQRWASPTDKAAFSAAKPTWAYSQNPGLHALRYALGTWERDETDPDAIYQRTFGMALPLDGIIVEDFVELANVCDANGWKVDGEIFEPGDRWENLKNICAAGAAKPCWKGGRLGLKITAPRVSLDTITRDDLADDDISVPATRSYRDRLNTIIPKYRDPNQKWTYTASNPVQVTAYVTMDGEERSEERQYNLVAGNAEAADQVAQLAAYELVDGRELFPIDLVCKPRMRHYKAGDKLTVDIPEAGLIAKDCVIERRIVDPSTMKVTFQLKGETAAKHPFALGQTGTSPPAVSILPPGEMDGAVNGANPSVPGPGDWNLSGVTLTEGGGAIPALVLTGAVGTGSATDIIVEIRKVSAMLAEDGTPILTEAGAYMLVEGEESPWTADATLPASATYRLISNAVVPGSVYQVGVSYRVGTKIGDRLILGPVLAGALSTPRGAFTLLGLGDLFPVTSNDNSVTITAVAALLDDGTPISLPAGSVTGLASSEVYGVFWNFVAGAYEVEVSPALTRLASRNYVFMGWATTSSGGVYEPPPAPPPGFGGDGPRVLNYLSTE